MTYYVGTKDKGKKMISKIQFKNGVERYWIDIPDYVSSYTSLTGTGQDPSSAQANLLRLASGFGFYVRQVYGPVIETEINNYIQALIAGLFEAVALVSYGVDTNDLTNRVATNVITPLATKLSTLNSDWPANVVSSLFVNMWNSWINQAKAAKINDIGAFQLAENSSIESASTFSNAFIQGVFKQYPPLFF